MNLKTLRKLMNPKAGMLEGVLQMAVPALNEMLDRINRPKAEGGLLEEEDFCAGFAVLPHQGRPVPMLFTLRSNEQGLAYISSKIPISELEKSLNDGSPNPDEGESEE